MNKEYFFIQNIYKKIAVFIEQRVNEYGAQYFAFGIFGLINYPLSYLIWHKAMPQIYNPFSLRCIATSLCIPLIFEKKIWPLRFKKYLPIYWYLSLLYCLPFFGTFMLLKNNFSIEWLMNNVLGIFLFILLVDWLSFIILITLGIAIGYFAFYSTGGSIDYPVKKAALDLAIYMYTFAIIIGAFFSRNNEILIKERLQTIRMIGASIAHELRTPLRSISFAADGVKKYVPKLLETYELAKKEKLAVPYISSAHYNALLSVCENLQSETQSAFSVIDMLLINVTESVNTHDFKSCSIHHCINEALRRYPFDKGEAKLVTWEKNDDFSFNGNDLLIIHVLFNLLKNAFYQIKAVEKGEIKIWTEQYSNHNSLHFKDTAKGISPKTLPHIFDRFYTRSYHGTGIGLAFCKIVMENLNGKITCHSVEGEFAEFILCFPRDKVSKENPVLELVN